MRMCTSATASGARRGGMPRCGVQAAAAARASIAQAAAVSMGRVYSVSAERECSFPGREVAFFVQRLHAGVEFCHELFLLAGPPHRLAGEDVAEERDKQPFAARERF